MEKTGSSWTVPVALDEIPETGLHREIEATAEIRAALAALAGVRDLPALSASFDLVRRGEGVHVSGRVQARVGQTCVVTLEPIENSIDEVIDVRFTPGAEVDAAAAHGAHVVDEDDDEPPEPLLDGKVDLGALATEFLLLGIDPYPRKPGAEFAPVKEANAGDHPFAGLDILKKRLGSGHS
jgi:Large ribosomal RNA subunit accumulation protein YceD